MSTSCEGIRVALKSCLIRSDCVIRQNHLPSECLKEHFEDLPDECKQLRQSLFECKRGMVRTISYLIVISVNLISVEQLDMRNRFRGNPGAKISSRLQEEQAQDLA
jgi:cytochrome c oxidase assembly factor 5